VLYENKQDTATKYFVGKKRKELKLAMGKKIRHNKSLS
jgi:hypothetical protein